MLRSRSLRLTLVLLAFAVTLLACSAPPAGPFPPPPGRLEACTELDATITIPDADFRDYLHVRTGIPAGQPLTCGALRALDQLYLGATRSVRSLEGVEHLQGVTRISLYEQNLLTDAEFDRLGALVNNTSLGIYEAALLTSIEFVEAFVGLTSLQLDDTGLKTLAGVEDLTELGTLFVRGNSALTSAAPVTDLVNLEVVQLTGSGVSSLEPFNGKPNLRRLMATNNALTSVGVRDLPALEELQVTGNQIEALPQFRDSGFPNLRLIAVGHNRLTDLAGLEGLTLRFLAASGNQLTTMHHIADLTGVEDLYLDDNLLVDMTPLGSIEWTGDATVWLGENCLGALYFVESRLYSMPAGPNNEVWKDLTFTKGVNVHLGPLDDARCNGQPGY
ncbi:MAG: leucine-rich repeat domain-containing protein [Trueperaceae bacterium]